MIKAQTLKGFRDFLPAQTLKRQYLIKSIKSVFKKFGFDPLETPALEYAETLMGKYGSEADKLLYLFEDHGGRKVGMRYDQTVPLSRVISTYQNDLPIPFKRYQIQPVWRAENTQKGRFREFLQCDIDTIGSISPLADAEIVACALDVLRGLGLNDAVMSINDRTIFDALGLSTQQVIIIDKLDKIGRDGVIAELEKIETKDASKLFETLTNTQLSASLDKIFAALIDLGYKQDVDFKFDPFLARGLDYYTSTIFELKSASYPSGSLAGGGRYDNLIGQFSGTDQPAVGLAFGFDRLLEILDEQMLLPTLSTATTVLITIFTNEQLSNSINLLKTVRANGFNAEIYLDPNAKLEKQLKYSDKKGIPYVIIQGPDEITQKIVKLKSMATKEQFNLTIEEAMQVMSGDRGCQDQHPCQCK